MLDAVKIRSRLRYDHRTGELYWLPGASGKSAFDCKVAGSPNSEGYIHVSIDGRLYKAHRLIWILVHGHWPIGVVDHVNGNRSDNRLENLRDVGATENAINRCIQVNNQSGIAGVRWKSQKKKWVAQICVSKRQIHLGYFDTIERAASARAAAEAKYFGEFARQELTNESL